MHFKSKTNGKDTKTEPFEQVLKKLETDLIYPDN